ncbi:(2Fe-2S)-binding protein [Bacillus sp. FJAT-44742]|uniref:(2Fe-2S)-binding protein n=1 Tax=Bacillus sp. FJAT-44742 TaxID=2014005 RepID=UPI001E3CD454|nr:(2Fe-2S)-binding protein [Bacillus sp. FJAT-44742]
MDKKLAMQDPPAEQQMVNIFLTINNKPVYLTVPPAYRLIDMLRKELNFTGTKISCSIGRCGACSVILNGELVNACLVLAYQVNGGTITTIEGVGEEGELDPVQEAFLNEGGFQCGYCTPGMIMAVKALLKEIDVPSEADIKEALSGNICRCTGYAGIIRAVYRAVENTRKKGE